MPEPIDGAYKILCGPNVSSGFANNLVKKFEGKDADDGAGDGHAAWEALNERYNSYIKKDRCACLERLANTNMKPGQDPDDLFSVLNGCCDLPEKMGQTVHGEFYEEIILQALLAAYERV